MSAKVPVPELVQVCPVATVTLPETAMVGAKVQTVVSLLLIVAVGALTTVTVTLNGPAGHPPLYANTE